MGLWPSIFHGGVSAMDFAHETKKKRDYLMDEQDRKVPENAGSKYPFESFEALLKQTQSIRPLLRKYEYP